MMFNLLLEGMQTYLFRGVVYWWVVFYLCFKSLGGGQMAGGRCYARGRWVPALNLPLYCGSLWTTSQWLLCCFRFHFYLIRKGYFSCTDYWGINPYPTTNTQTNCFVFRCGHQQVTTEVKFQATFCVIVHFLNIILFINHFIVNRALMAEL